VEEKWLLMAISLNFSNLSGSSTYLPVTDSYVDPVLSMTDGADCRAIHNQRPLSCWSVVGTGKEIWGPVGIRPCGLTSSSSYVA
jgi:hypothetical protein